jgi:ABC-type lipoprotein export system ATPase subunit
VREREAASGPILAELVEVQHRYERGDVVALEGVNLTLRLGEWLAIAGPSGSGKSTLLHLLCGLDRPTTGSVRYRGQEPRSPGEWASLRRRRIGFVFQSFHLLPTLSARENVEIPMFGVCRASERRARAGQLLAAVGLRERQHHRPAELSAGERQRVAIARSLANGPELVLADEPTGNLDQASSDTVIELLARQRRERELTLVVVTHSPEVAARADRVIRLVKGRLESEAVLA